MKRVWVVLGIVLLTVAGYMGYLAKVGRSSSTQTPTPNPSAETTMGEPEGTAKTTRGLYVEYSPTTWEEVKQSQRILFFYASWCPTCRPADNDFRRNENQLPAGVVVVRIHYNDPETGTEEKKLAKDYGITYQHTFVLIDQDGRVVKKWNGGMMKELLENLQ